MKLFEYNPHESDQAESERTTKEWPQDFEDDVNAFCIQVSVRFVVSVRVDVLAVWYEEKLDKDPVTLPASYNPNTQVLAEAFRRLPVSHLGNLSTRTGNCMYDANITILGQLLDNGEACLLRHRNFGKRSVKEIKSGFVQLGITLPR